MAEYFCGPGGSSGNAGTSYAARKATITQCIALATSAGDSVIAAPGVYRETVTIGSSGGNSYTAGTVSVTNGSATVIGSGTSWLANAFAAGVFRLHVLASGTDGVTNGTATFTSAAGNFQAGHVGYTIRIGTKAAYIISAVGSATSITLKNPDGSAPSPSAGTGLTYNVGPESPYDILSVDSNTQITLTQPWAGPSLTGIAYETWRPIKIIGDVSGAKTDGVGGVVRVTGSDNDTSATRSNAFIVSSKNYIYIQGFSLDGCSATLVSLTSQIGVIVQDCTFSSSSGSACQSNGLAQANLTIRRCKSFALGSHFSFFTHTVTIDNCGHIIENCDITNDRVGDGNQSSKIGGVLIRNCIFQNGSRAVATVGTFSTGQATTINNCHIHSMATGLSASVAGEIIEDYNNLFACSTARTSVTSGSNSTSVIPLFSVPILLAGYRLPWQSGAFSPYSTLAAKSGINPPADDFYGIPRPATNAKNSWGAIQFNPIIRDTTTKQAGSASLKLPDAGRHQMFVPVTAVSTTISAYVYREANYAGTNPQMVIRQAGQADITVTDAGSASGWNQITTTFTPAATSGYVVVEFVSSNSATSGSYAMYVDTMVVTTALQTGDFELWINDRTYFSNYAGTPGGGGVSTSSNGIFGGSVYKKNVAVTGFEFVLIDKSTGAAITSGTVTGYITKDGATQTTLAGSPTHKGNGQWNVDIAQAEMNADVVGLVFTHANSVNVGFTIRTVLTTPDDTYTRIGATGSGLTSLATPTNITGGTITTVTNLTNAPTNGDLTATMKTSVTAAVPTVAAIAAGVWDRLTSALTTVGSVGKLIVDNLNATITSRMATFSYTAPPTVGDIETQLSGVHGSGAWSTATGFATSGALTTVGNNVISIDTKLGTPAEASVSADIAALLVQILAILDDTGTSGVALSTAVKQAIADEVLKRGASNVDGSADYNSLYELIQTAISATLPTGSTTLTIYETDGVTVFNTREATLDEDALPVVGIQ